MSKVLEYISYSFCPYNPSIRRLSSVGISTRSMLITCGPALAQAFYDTEQEGLPSLQTLIYKACSFWNWLWPLPHLQWTSALNCMGFLISLLGSRRSFISLALFFSWDIKERTVEIILIQMGPHSLNYH